MEFNAFELLVQHYSKHTHHVGKISMRKKNIKSSKQEGTSSLLKRKKGVTIDEPMPLNVIECSPMSPSPYLFLPIILGQRAPTPPLSDLRKRKGVINDLTIDVQGMALYNGLALERLDHHVGHLPNKEIEIQFNAICEDIDSELILNCIMYQVCVILTLLFF